MLNTNLNQNIFKRKLLKNLIQLVIGIIFLFFSYQYLTQHPAEKTSIVSWVTILSQKVKVMFYSMFSDEWSTLDEKYKVERNFREILSTMDNSKCLTIQDYQEVKNKLDSIQDMNIEQYKINKYDIFNFMNIYMAKINKQCK